MRNRLHRHSHPIYGYMSLILRTETSIDLLLRTVDHIEQLVQVEGQMTTSPPPRSESTVASASGLPKPDAPHPVLRVRDKLGAHPSPRFFGNVHRARTEVTRGAKVTNDISFWLSMATEPIDLDIPQVQNPLFEKKGRAAEYQFLYIF